MTALAMDVRELSFDEVDEVAGGPGPLVMLLIVWGGRGVAFAAGAAVASVVGEFSVGVVEGFMEDPAKRR